MTHWQGPHIDMCTGPVYSIHPLIYTPVCLPAIALIGKHHRDRDFIHSTYDSITLGKSAACEKTVSVELAKTVLYSTWCCCPRDCRCGEHSTNGLQHTGLDSHTKQPLWFEIFKLALEYLLQRVYTQSVHGALGTYVTSIVVGSFRFRVATKAKLQWNEMQTFWKKSSWLKIIWSTFKWLWTIDIGYQQVFFGLCFSHLLCRYGWQMPVPLPKATSLLATPLLNLPNTHLGCLYMYHPTTVKALRPKTN